MFGENMKKEKRSNGEKGRETRTPTSCGYNRLMSLPKVTSLGYFHLLMLERNLFITVGILVILLVL